MHTDTIEIGDQITLLFQTPDSGTFDVPGVVVALEDPHSYHADAPPGLRDELSATLQSIADLHLHTALPTWGRPDALWPVVEVRGGERFLFCPTLMERQATGWSLALSGVTERALSQLRMA